MASTTIRMAGASSSPSMPIPPAGESDQALGITDQCNGQVHITIDTNDTGQSTDTIARGYRITLGIYERRAGDMSGAPRSTI